MKISRSLFSYLALSLISFSAAAAPAYNLPDELLHPIVTNISNNAINIDSKFKGEEILLFGARGDSGDILIMVKGPSKDFLINKKERLFGIWYNGKRMEFRNLPIYYSMFSTMNSANSQSRVLEELGLKAGALEIGKESEDRQKKEFLFQLKNRLEERNLYSPYPNKIEFLDETLFKVSLIFPKNVPPGTYVVEIYFISDGVLSSFQSIPIYVTQVGINATISDLSNNHSIFYGTFAVAVAVAIGFIINYIFSRLYRR